MVPDDETSEKMHYANAHGAENGSEHVVDAAWQRYCAQHIRPSRLLRLAVGLSNACPDETTHLEWCDQCRSVYRRYQSAESCNREQLFEQSVPESSALADGTSRSEKERLSLFDRFQQVAPLHDDPTNQECADTPVAGDVQSVCGGALAVHFQESPAIARHFPTFSWLDWLGSLDLVTKGPIRLPDHTVVGELWELGRILERPDAGMVIDKLAGGMLGLAHKCPQFITPANATKTIVAHSELMHRIAIKIASRLALQR